MIALVSQTLRGRLREAAQKTKNVRGLMFDAIGKKNKFETNQENHQPALEE
jgi:hypothetical protein